MSNVKSMETIIYNQDGKEVGKIKLPEAIFGLPWKADLVHQVAISMQSNLRHPIAHTKGRGDVRGGGKKPWQQKGTGRARHGSTRSPIWVGGGVAHGPTSEKNFSRKISKKTRTAGFFSILSQKWRDGEIMFVDNISFTAPKTAEAIKILHSLGRAHGSKRFISERGNSALIALFNKDKVVFKSFKNISGVALSETRNLNPLDLLATKFCIFTNPAETIAFFEKRVGATQSE